MSGAHGDGAIDPDVGLDVPGQRSERALDPVVLGVIAAGGILGAEARYAVERAIPTPAGAWPLATWGINVVGSLLIGVLMVVVTESVPPHRLARPFLGVGVLGGFTTFSTAMVEGLDLLRGGRPALAALYLVGTALSALLAAAVGAAATRGVRRALQRTRVRREPTR